MTQLAFVGDVCPNPECDDYGDVEVKVIIRYGKTRDGRQRYQCKSCQKTFNERKGTMFYNRKTEEKDILECLALLAEGVRISSISRSKGFKEDTILSFLREASHHAEQVEDTLLHEVDAYAIGRLQWLQESGVLLFSQVENMQQWIAAIIDGTITATEGLSDAFEDSVHTQIYAVRLNGDAPTLILEDAAQFVTQP